MKKSEQLRRAKLKRLKAALAKGEADYAAGRYTVLGTEGDLDALFAQL